MHNSFSFAALTVVQWCFNFFLALSFHSRLFPTFSTCILVQHLSIKMRAIKQEVAAVLCSSTSISVAWDAIYSDYCFPHLKL